jgi:hypothetical protein
MLHACTSLPPLNFITQYINCFSTLASLICYLIICCCACHSQENLSLLQKSQQYSSSSGALERELSELRTQFAQLTDEKTKAVNSLDVFQKDITRLQRKITLLTKERDGLKNVLVSI